MQEHTPVIGYRHWNLFNGKLNAKVYRAVWEPDQVMKAVCVPNETHQIGRLMGQLETPHKSPNPNCMCGVQGYKSIELLAKHECRFLSGKFVMGQCSLWGDVDEYENSYRAEFGYPYCLYKFDTTIIPAWKLADVDAVAAQYHIDVVPAPEVLQKAVDHEMERYFKMIKTLPTVLQKYPHLNDTLVVSKLMWDKQAIKE